jgi:gas vesicle protein
MKNTRLILGIAAGVAAGALLGVLLAPDRGAATRKKIVSKGKEFGSDMNHLMEARLDDLMKSLGGKFVQVKKENEPVKPVV